MAAAPLRSLIVTGATGKQGGALISALISPSQPNAFKIYALTRDKTSNSAKRLAEKSSNIHLIEGNFAKPAEIFSQVKDPWGIFLVTMPMNAKQEEAEGKGMAKAAIEAGVKHVVFTSVERGGPQKSEDNPTPVPHFISKYNIEKYIQEEAKKSGSFTYTFMRPVAFMDNLTNDFLGKAFVSCWKLNGTGKNTMLQLVSTRDIGKVAADALLKSETDEYRNGAISLAGAGLTVEEAAKLFKETTGNEIPTTYSFIAVMLKWLLREQLSIMFDWFRTDGFGANLSELKKRYPFLKDFRQWLEEDSAWQK